MPDPYLRDLTIEDSEVTCDIVIQRWIKQACVAQSIATTSADPLLRDITLQDLPPLRQVILQRWFKQLSNA